MKTKRLIIPEDKIVSIKDFMEIYLKVEYDYDEGRTTHYTMEQYLFEKGEKLPIKVSFKNVKILDINNGRYIAVREETKRKKKGKLLIYENPSMFDPELIIEELSSTKNENKKKHELEQARKKVLEQCYGMTLDEMGEIVEISELERIKQEESYEITESVNRQHVYQLSNGKHLKKKGRY